MLLRGRGREEAGPATPRHHLYYDASGRAVTTAALKGSAKGKFVDKKPRGIKGLFPLVPARSGFVRIT